MVSFFTRSHTFAIDLGTNNTLVYAPHKGIVLDEPTSIARDIRRHLFFQSGLLSHQMQGKTPQHIEVMHPLSKGAIANIEVAKAYIKEVMRRIVDRRWLKPRIVVSVPSDLSLMERQAVIEASKEGGAAEVALLKDPFSAALGAQLSIDRAEGILVLDMGAGVSEISLLCLSGLVMSRSIRVGGNDIDEALVEYFKEKRRILLSKMEAENIKKVLGDVCETHNHTLQVSVKNLITRMPETLSIEADDVRKAILPLVDKVVDLTHNMLSSLPPAFASDVYDQGIVLTGGSSLLKGMDTYMAQALNIKVQRVENPLHNIILGAGRVLEETRLGVLCDT